MAVDARSRPVAATLRAEASSAAEMSRARSRIAPAARTAGTTGSGSSGLFWASAGALLGAGLVLGLGRLRGTRRQESDETLDPDLPASVDVITSDR